VGVGRLRRLDVEDLLLAEWLHVMEKKRVDDEDLR